MAKSYVVAPGRSVLLREGKLLKAGSRIPADVPEKCIKEWESTGYIKRRGGEIEPEAPKTIMKTTGDVSVDNTVTTHGRFNRNPADLEGRDLAELNTMLVDLNADPADTVEEAIGLLSQDFNA